MVDFIRALYLGIFEILTKNYDAFFLINLINYFLDKK